MSTTSERQESYRKAVRRASACLPPRNGPTVPRPGQSALGDLQTSAVCFQLTGYPEHAARLLRHILAVYFRVDGSFRQPDDDGTLAEHMYAPSWTTVGAHLNGFFDLSLPAMDAILRYQDPRTGGLFGHPRFQRLGGGVIMPSVTAVRGGGPHHRPPDGGATHRRLLPAIDRDATRSRPALLPLLRHAGRPHHRGRA